MSDATRRGFLVIAGAGAAATMGAVVAGTRSSDGAAASVQDLSKADLATADSFVVHVKDVKRGQLAILVGEREVLVTDRELAARLAGATV